MIVEIRRQSKTNNDNFLVPRYNYLFIFDGVKDGNRYHVEYQMDFETKPVYSPNEEIQCMSFELGVIKMMVDSHKPETVRLAGLHASILFSVIYAYVNDFQPIPENKTLTYNEINKLITEEP